MHVRFAFLFVLGLLVAPTTIAADSSSTTSQTEPATSPGSDGSSTTNIPVISSSSATDASSAFPDTLGTTQSAAPLPSGATSPAVSTVAPTAAGSTVSSGPTTSAPLPNVTVNFIEFSQATCDASVCTYSISAPGNNQAFLATEDSIIATDRSKFSGLQSKAANEDSAIEKANKDAQEKVNQLQALLNNIQANLNQIQGSITTIKQQQDAASSTLYFVQQFINDVNSARDTCLYQRCLKPTTPAPPTTTPTPAPTTPSSPCANFTCPDDHDGSAHCKLDSYNKPNCDNCLSNFNGSNHCYSVTCNSLGSGFVVNSTTESGVLYSTGYNLANPENSSIPAGANCKWNTIGIYQIMDLDNYNLTCLAAKNVVMYVNSQDGFNQMLSSGLSARSLNKVLAKIPNATFTLTSTRAESSYCSIPLTLQPPTTSAPSLAVEKKQNGFFSWLMGY